MRHIAELVFVLFIVLLILAIAGMGEEGAGQDTQTQFYVGPDPAGGWSLSAGAPGRSDHGTLSSSGKWLCIEHYNPHGYWWRPWPER